MGYRNVVIIPSQTQCFTDCVDCPVGFFNDRPRARICTPCSRCEDYHRTTLKDCTPSSNANCSKCNDGYAENKDTEECEKSSSLNQNWTKALEQPDSGRRSFTNVIVYVLLGIIIIAKGVWIITAWKKRGNRRTYNTDSETTASTSSDDVRDDITSEKIQMLPTPNSSDKENTPMRPPHRQSTGPRRPVHISTAS
ncbi:hypothetical protein LSAT2_012097 [Lamellibrachia satsuma]|nr:hypothetical protein LSAT2_012097 [Lamellibrachia satsuma]